ncbi:hypothetical protein [Phytohabitans maris]|uniref:hypothetical protein n=1 Tax=Phytohabitans maris TaxID=3071409 RepID=UPI00280AC306|nr:hypothetical protein [Phytohabitans sp. ZYX-F-186]
MPLEHSASPGRGQVPKRPTPAAAAELASWPITVVGRDGDDAMMVVYRRPGNRVWLTWAPQLASWDRTGAPSQLRLAQFLAHADASTSALLTGDGPFAVELTVGLPDGTALDTDGRDLDNYLYPLAQHLGATRFAAVFGRKTRGRSWLATGPAVPDTKPATAPRFTARLTGSYVRPEWKRALRDLLIRDGVTPAPAGPLALHVTIGTGPARNWANLWKPLIDSLGPLLGEHPGRPFHPHDDRIVDLSLHHHIDAALGYDVQVGLRWAPLTATTVPS